MGRLTLAIITLDEEKNIERCVRSVPFASEIIVVDSGSADATVEKAKALGAVVCHNKWPGYGAQKAFAAGRASGDWILSLDADEWLSPALAEEIRAVTAEGPPGVFSMPRLSWFLGRPIRHGGWFPDRQTRLYARGDARWDPGESIHESLKTTRPVRKLNGALFHEPFASVREQVEVNFRYAALLAEKRFAAGRRVRSSAWIVLLTLAKFMENYVWKAGFLDGLPGFIIAFNSAQSRLVQLCDIYSRTVKSGAGPE